MDHGKNIDPVGLDVVNEAVRTFQNFPNLLVLELRDDAPRQGEVSNLLGASVKRSTNLRA